MSDIPNPNDLDAIGGPPDEVLPPTQNTMADLPGQLKEWLGGVAGRMSGWASDAATIVNDFLTRRDIADTASAQAAQFSESVQAFSNGLDQVVRADPTATNMALGLAAITVPAMIDDHPFMPEDQRGPVSEALAGEVGKSIARNAVISWAQRDTPTAHAELSRLGGLFTTDERGALSDHVNLLGDARQTDTDASAIQAANDRAEESHRRSIAYGDQLIRPDGTPQFPAGWMQRVANDQGVSPDDTAQLGRVMQKMMDNAATGAPTQSNGLKFGDFLDMAGKGIAGRRQLMEQVINGNLAPQTAQALVKASPSDLTALGNLYQNARKAAAGPDGDLINEATSDALGKKMETMIGAYSRWGVGALDPKDPNFFGAMHKGFAQSALDQRIAMETKARSLGDIFAGRQAAARNLEDIRLQNAQAEHQRARVERQQLREAEAKKQAEEFGLRQKIEEAHKKEAEAQHTQAREERQQAAARQHEIRQLAQQEHAKFAEAAARARLERASALGTGGNAPPAIHPTPPPQPTDTFRRFSSLGRPERA